MTSPQARTLRSINARAAWLVAQLVVAKSDHPWTFTECQLLGELAAVLGVTVPPTAPTPPRTPKSEKPRQP